MFTPQEILLSDFQKLQKLVESEKATDILEIAPILRRWFLDDTPLIHVVNRKIKHKLEFLIPERHLEPVPDFIKKAALRIVNYHRIPGPKRSLNLEKFLKMEIMGVAGECMTVRDYIKFLANKVGGVHFYEKRSKVEFELGKIGREFEVAGAPSGLFSITPIAISSIDAVLPIIRGISRDKPPHPTRQQLTNINY